MNMINSPNYLHLHGEKITAIIFDMDGVLVDSEPATVAASLEALEEIGVFAKPEDFHEFTGMGDDKFISGVAEKYGAQYNSSIKERMYDIFVEKAAERVRVMPWSRSLIETLKKRGFKLAVASASDLKKVLCNISCIGVKPDVFDTVITGSDVERKKPAPDIFLKAMEQLNIKDGAPSPAQQLISSQQLVSSQCLVCEDAISGVMAAKAAGMTCVAVTTSFERAQLAEVGADLVLSDLAELSDIPSLNR